MQSTADKDLYLNQIGTYLNTKKRMKTDENGNFLALEMEIEGKKELTYTTKSTILPIFSVEFWH